VKDEFNRAKLLALIDKYLSGQATEEEKEFLEAYYEYFEKEEATLEMATAQQKEQLKQQMLAVIMQEIGRPKQTSRITSKALQQTPRRQPVWKTFARVAAIIVFSAILSFYFITDDPVGLITGNTTITAVADQGQPKDIFLSDGSIVTLNERSTLSYPSQFDEGSRQVELKGEGYFDITHNASQPFIVNSGKVNVRVLGTAFNVNAKPDDQEIEVTVTRGKVQVSENSEEDRELGTITANQQISYNIATGNFTQTDLEAAKATGWKPAQYTIDNVTLTGAARIIEKRFDKAVVFEGEDLPDYTFTASFYERDTLNELLTVISKVTNTRYQIEENKVFISVQ